MKVLATAFLAPLLLNGAAYPETAKDSDAGLAPAQESTMGSVNYRPCRPGPGDDNCIQLYERGVRGSYAQWLRAHDAQPAPTQLAMGGPEPRASAPRHSSNAAHDPRCVENDDEGGEARGM